jgi:hypothetical protein
MQKPDFATGPRRNICLHGKLPILDKDNKVWVGRAQVHGLPQSLTKGLLEILVTDREYQLGTP